MLRILILLTFFTVSTNVYAHDVWDKYNHPLSGVSCCNGKDCRFMSTEETNERLTFNKDGSITVDKKHVFKPNEINKDGPGNSWGICEFPYIEDGKSEKIIRCLIEPGGMS